MIYDDIVYIDGAVEGRICRWRPRQNVVYLRCTSCYINNVKGGIYINTKQIIAISLWVIRWISIGCLEIGGL